MRRIGLADAKPIRTAVAGTSVPSISERLIVIVERTTTKA
jgi:hypothetical protein